MLGKLAYLNHEMLRPHLGRQVSDTSCQGDNMGFQPLKPLVDALSTNDSQFSFTNIINVLLYPKHLI